MAGGPVENAAFIGDAKRPKLLTTGPSASLWTVAAEALEWRQLPWDGGRLLTSSDREAVLRRCGDLRWLGVFGPLHGFIKYYSPAALGRTGSGLIVVSSDRGLIEAWRRPPEEKPYGDAELVWAFGGRDAADQRLTRCCDRWRLVVSPRRGRVVVLDAETGAAVTAFTPPARPTAIAAHPDRPLVALGGRDGSLSWWDARSGHCLGHVQAHGGQVHILHWSGHGRLVPQRVGRPSWVMDGGDVETLLDDVRHHWDDGPASVTAVRELASGDLDKAWHGTAVDALADLTVNGADPAARETAAIALAQIDEGEATTALYRMFERHDGHGSAGRLLAYFTGEDEATTEELIATLPGIGNFLGVLTSATLGERGAAAVPAVHAALRAFPFPAREDAGHWFRDESTKYRLMYALKRAGAAAAPATLTLLAVLEDDEIYRDTRHQAEVTLQAIGLPETADTIAAEVRRRAGLVVHGENRDDGEDDETEGFSLLLDVLLGMPPAALAASREVGPALEAVRRRFGDGIRTYEENGEIREYTVYEIRLTDHIDEKIAEQIKR